MNILVIGGNGQLGQCIQNVTKEDTKHSYTFIGSIALDITNKEEVKKYFQQEKYDYCVNCAAYTAVDKAETESTLAHQVNAIGAQNLAIACKITNTTLIHISTDFVFDGASTTPYVETDTPNPTSVYGKTKLEGEAFIQDEMENYFILRTSWLYSEYANNFMKTMLRLAQNLDELNIVSDQIGTPTYAKDLAEVIVHIIETSATEYGVYHYSNEGVASWYDFAKEIFALSDTEIKLGAIPTSSYPTPAERPKYSVLDKSKIKRNLKLSIANWEDSLQKAITALKAL